MKKYTILLVLGLVVIIGLTMLLLSDRPKMNGELEPTPTSVEGLETYSNPRIGFMVNHDSMFQVRQNSESDVQFYFHGPTQSEGTEVYDGIILSFQKAPITGTLDSFIEEQMKSFQDVGSIIEPLHDVILNGIPAKSFRGSGLGEFTLIFIPLDDENLLVASYLVSDPGNLGFQAKVDQILATFTLVME